MMRFLDLVISIFSVLMLLPLFVACSVILRYTGENKVFYTQVRIGLDGQPFSIYKFATMLENSPYLEGGTITVENDPRILPFGHFLRKTKINELPQLFNVILGSMSLVGPRPMTSSNFSLYTDSEKFIIQSMKPGITGIGSIIFRSEEKLLSNVEEPDRFYAKFIAPNKAMYEAWYFNNRSTYTYFCIIFITIWVVIFPRSRVLSRVFKNLPEPSLVSKNALDLT